MNQGTDLRPLSDEVLLARLDALVAREREGIVEVVEHLMEADRRDIVLDRGYPSLFQYCVKKLGFSEQAAYARIRAARAARDFSDILPRLRSGELHLEAVVRLSPHLTLENQSLLISRALGATTYEVQALVAEAGGGLPVERDLMRPVPASSAQARDGEIVPPPNRVRLAFTADDDLVRMVVRLKSLLRHKFPHGRLEDQFKEAADSLLDRVDPDRKRTTRVSGTTSFKSGRRSRRVPQVVRDEVWRRDGGRCAYIAEDGRRCDSSDALEFDHVIPWALGGVSDDPANIRILCRPHNQRLARRRFGPRARSRTAISR